MVIWANINMFTNLSDQSKHEHLSETHKSLTTSLWKQKRNRKGRVYEASCDVLPLLSSQKIQFLYKFLDTLMCTHCHVILIVGINYVWYKYIFFSKKRTSWPDNIWRYISIEMYNSVFILYSVVTILPVLLLLQNALKK